MQRLILCFLCIDLFLVCIDLILTYVSFLIKDIHK